MASKAQKALEKSKKKRDVHKELTTQLMMRISSILSELEADESTLHEALEELIENENLIKALDEEIEEITEDLTELEIEIKASAKFKNEIRSCKSKLKKSLKNLSKSTKGISGQSDGTDLKEDKNDRDEVPDEQYEKTSEADSENTEIISAARLEKKKYNIKLPKLEIHRFEGDCEKWQSFWSQFESAIHNNEQLSEIEKFNYLKSYISGSAKIAIEGLTITDKNYETAIEILKSRFGRKDVIVRAHINKLMNLNAVKNVSHLRDLRDLYDTCEVQTRSLENLGVGLDSYGSLLFPMLVKLVPDEIALEFNRKNSEDEAWDVKNFLNFFREEIENRERTFLFRRKPDYEQKTPYADKKYTRNMSTDNKQDPRVSSTGERNRRSPPSASALSANVEKDCLFCLSPDHKSDVCDMPIEEKKNTLRKHGRCFNCLMKRHMVKSCLSKVRCSTCNRKHNKLICDEKQKRSPDSNEENKLSDPNKSESISQNSAISEHDEEILLQTATAQVAGASKTELMRCLLDNGSQRTFILEDCAERLKLEIVGEENISVHSFGSKESDNQKVKRVKLALRNPKNPKINIIIEAIVVPNISSGFMPVPGIEIKNYCRKNRLQLADVAGKKCNMKISLLIGSDFYWKIVTGKVRRLSGALVAAETKLGWTINGTESISSKPLNTSVNVLKAITHSQAQDNENLSQLMRKFWELEALGITTEKDNLDAENEKVLEEFNTQIKFKENRYQVALPWNEKAEELHNNFETARKRFQALNRRFQRDSDFQEKYKAVIEKHLAEDIAEEVTEQTEVPEEARKIYYMPHQAIIKEDRVTTKLRVVFDASSHAEDELSLNDCLHSGPYLNPDILEILIKFRLNRIAITADIEQAFLQILLRDEDKDAVRFLWLKDEKETNEAKILRMTRVIFGAKSSPFLLAATIKYHIKKFEESFPEAFSSLNNCLYVDDLITGTEEENAAKNLAEDVKKVLKAASFNMTKWKTNCEKVQKIWDETGNPKTEQEESKVLGYIWFPEQDTFNCRNVELQKEPRFSKRGVLEIAGRIFDPLGFLNPFTVRAKILVQEIWQSGTDWDSPLSSHLEDRFKKWCEELPKISEIKISRHYFENCKLEDLSEFQLHYFADASEIAYGTVVYFRYRTMEDVIRTAFVLSKSRVTPLKKISLPRLELMAALLSAKLSQSIKSKLSNLPISSYYWTDSTIVLNWVKGRPGDWKPFVQNRVREIQDKTETSAWSHCPGKVNPADLLTRGETLEKLQKDYNWWHGPNWLAQEEKLWPKEHKCVIEREDIEIEKKKQMNTKKEISQLTTVVIEKKEELLDIQKYSSLSKLLRITAWIMRFAHNCRKKGDSTSGFLTAEEIDAAEKYWTKVEQTKIFPKELEKLKKRKTCPTDSRILLFNPFLDEYGIMRVGGRLQRSNFTYQETHPILIHEKSYLTELLIKHCHEKVGHGGVEETLIQTREKFWILKGRQKIKSVLHKCVICKRFRAKPLSQDMAPLPPDRIQEVSPFLVTGIDFAGPLFAKGESGTRKAYIALFTCAVTRAVHLELVTDLTTPNFLLALRRFIARRGICQTIYTDNAKTFKRANMDLERLWKTLKDTETLKYFSENRITWKYIVAKAAWWGGFWERLVRSTKSCLKKILGKTILNFEELLTVLSEVEAILNSRPMTFVYNEVEEPESLTPGHFLLGRRPTALPRGGEPVPWKSDKEELTKRCKYRMTLMQNFWKKWRQSYLLELKSAHQVKERTLPVEIKEGMVVLVHEEKQPRLMWKLGLITETHKGRDGKVRSCTVKTSGGVVLKRPVQLLYNLEL